MKKFLLLTMASLMTVFAMAIGRNDGSSKPNAKDFNWETGAEHPGGTLWYRVQLDELDKEEHPALNLYLTNPSRDKVVGVDVTADIMGETRSKHYDLAPHENKSWSESASALKNLDEIYLVLTSTDPIFLSAKVVEATDLDETCVDNSRVMKWNTVVSQTAGFAAWWKLDISDFKLTQKKDVKLTLTNKGNAELTVRAGVSFDCPSSGLTERTTTIAAGKSVSKVFPGSTLRMLKMDEIYGYVENNQLVEMLIEEVDAPDDPIFDDCNANNAVKLNLDGENVIYAEQKLYYVDVAEALSVKSYEPEFTIINKSGATAKVKLQQAFECAAYSANETNYTIANNENEVVVYKRNMFEGLNANVERMYLLITSDQEVVFNGRLKHIREGKACKVNIDFNWETGHRQAAGTTQWYAVSLKDAKQNKQDVTLTVQNLSQAGPAKLTAEISYSCPSFDTQKFTRDAPVGKPISHTFEYGFYSLMGDTVFVGLKTTQDVRITATTKDATPNFQPEEACFNATLFKWDEGGSVDPSKDGENPKWFKVAMKDTALIDKARHPVLFVQNYGDKAAKVKVTAVESCTSEFASKEETRTIAANGVYQHDVAFDLLKNFSKDTIYVRVESTERISFEIRLTEKPAGSDCSAAIPFNWTSGIDQVANANLWYEVDLKDVMRAQQDVIVRVVNKENKPCDGKVWIAFTCPFESPQVQNFSLEAKADKSKRMPYSMIETVKDSVVYIRLIANTAMHVEARPVEAKLLDEPIDCSQLNFIDFEFDKLYNQSEESAWYLLTGDVLETLKDERITPELWVHNLADGRNRIKAEVAYHCPIVRQMASKSEIFAQGQELSKLIERTTFDQILDKDSVLIRLTADGEFEFKASLVDPNTGGDEMHPITISSLKDIEDTTYVQEANTTRWYRIRTKEFRKDESLHGKSLHVQGKNHGDAADIEVAVYEDAAELDDLLEGRGKRTVSAGRSFSRSIPAYAIHAAAEAEFLVKVTTNQKLSCKLKLNDYASAAVDPDQEKATLAVPNVDYIIPADTTMWFVMCVPYMRNNFELSVDDIVHFRNMGDQPAKVTVTGTCQPKASYDIPVRSRTIAAGRGGSKSVKGLIDKAIEKAGFKYRVSEMKTTLIDSLLNRFLTSDSVEAYVRIHTTQPLYVRLDSKRKAGDACLNPMNFDWEHGIVNPEENTSWILVDLQKGNRVPEGFDLKLHLDKWDDAETAISGTIHTDKCDSPEDESYSFNLNVLKDTVKVLEREMLEKWGWTNLLLEYNSSKTTHVWAELVEQEKRDTIGRNRDTVYVCYGTEYDGDDFQKDVIRTITSDSTWYSMTDSIDKETAKYYIVKDTFNVFLLREPELIDINELSSKPVIKRGEPISNLEASANEIRAKLEDARTDSIMYVGERDSVIWQYSLNDGVEYFDVDPDAPFSTEGLVLRYRVITECGNEIFSDSIHNDVIGDITAVKACESYSWFEYKDIKKDSLLAHTFPLASGCDSIGYVQLTINQPQSFETNAGEVTESYTWEVNGKEYKETPTFEGTVGRDEFVKPGQDGECDTTYVLLLTIKPLPLCSLEVAEVEEACQSFEWRDGNTYTESKRGITYRATGLNGECDTIYTLDLTINQPQSFETNAGEVADSYTWEVNGKEYTETPTFEGTVGKDQFVKEGKDGQCDTTYVLLLTIKHTPCTPVEVAESEKACQSFTWRDGKTYTATERGITYTAPGLDGQCDTIYTLDLIINEPLPVQVIDTTVCERFFWEINGEVYTESASGISAKKDGLEGECDTLFTLNLTVNKPQTIPTEQTFCKNDEALPFVWEVDGSEFAEVGHFTKQVVRGADPLKGICDTTYTLDLTILATGDSIFSPEDACNFYTWELSGETYVRDTTVSRTVGRAANGCDSIITLDLKLGSAVVMGLPASEKIGNRLLMINRKQIMERTGWQLDSIYVEGAGLVVQWYIQDQENDKWNLLEGKTGYYLTTEDGSPLPSGFYMAEIRMPAENGNCSALGYTEKIDCTKATAPAPALVPSIARPGEQIRVINLDPEQANIIRVYTAEGFRLGSYNVSGESIFQLKAAADQGFYIVEINNDSMKSTLRYIVK